MGFGITNKLEFFPLAGLSVKFSSAVFAKIPGFHLS